MHTTPAPTSAASELASRDLALRVREAFEISLDEIVADLTWPASARGLRRETVR